MTPMIDFYLITGFLGSGKTTFLKNFIRLFADKRIRLVVNEFGTVGVDGQLLNEVGAVLDEINNGSIFCSCRLDKFEETLEKILADPPEVVIVEASGLSDPTSIRRVLGDARFTAYDYKGAICIVDAARFHKVIETARVCAKQLSVGDVVLLNKIDIAGEELAEAAGRTILERYPDTVIHPTIFGRIEPAWLEALGRNRGGDEDVHNRDITLQDYTITVRPAMSPRQLEHFIGMFIEDTYRVKGFVLLGEEVWLVDCVGALVNLAPWEGGRPERCGQIVALAGRGMNPRKSIRKAIELYPDYIESFR